MSVPTSISNIDILTADRSATIASIGDVRNYVQRATVKGRLMQGETLTVELVAGANTFTAIKNLDYGQVLDITSWTNQYFIQKIRRNYPDVGGLQIEARAYYERLKYSRAKRTYSETKRVDRVFTIYAQTPETALATIMGSAPSGFAAGSVSTLTTEQKAAEITLSLEDDTHWRAIEKLCEAIQAKTGVACEFYFTRSGDTYQVNLVQQVGISGNRSVKAGGGSASSPSNRLNLERTTHGDDYFSRLSAKMGDAAENITLGRDFDGRPIHWGVETNTPSTPSPGLVTLTLTGEPVPYDTWATGQGDDAAHYFGNEAEGFFRITGSTYPNTIVIRTGTTGITDGYFASDALGAALDYIRAADVEGDYGVVEKAADIQGVPVPNLIRRAGDSDDMETFVSGLPKGWSKIGGAATTVAQVTDERYAEVGTKSAQVQAGIGGGLRSAYYTVRGGLASALARLSVEAGEVQIRMSDEDGNSFPGPDEGQAVSSSRALQAISLGVWNTFESGVAIEILATKPDTVFYVDAVTLTPSNGSHDWAPVMGGREMWAETGRLLTLEGGTIWSELSGTSIDLSEVTGFNTFDAFELGALVTIQDGYDGSTHDVNFSTRVIEFSKPIIGMAPEATWVAERVREDFIDYLRAGKPVRPRPVPQTPTTPRYPPRLAVERADVADADGGGNPGVEFTLFPKTSKNEDLENWEIFVSVDGAAFASIGTDETSLSPDASSAYYVGGGYATVLGTTAQPTYSVTYPPDDGSVKSVRFYVVARSTGLASSPEEFLVRNPEIAAGQITGTLIAEQLSEAAQSYGKTFAFSSADADTVAWGAGVLTMASGAGFNINAGNTGDMTFGSTYFIFLDPDTSTTDLQVSTTNADAVGSRKVLLAVAQKSLVSASAFFQDAVGVLSLTNEQLAVDSVLANNIKANQIAAVHMTAASIEALHLAANAVTLAKLNFIPLVSTSGTGDIVATINATGEGIAIDAQFISIGGTSTFTTGYDPSLRADIQRATTAPSTRADGSALRAGDLWIDTDDNDLVYSWTGAAWEASSAAGDFNVTIRQNAAPTTRADGSALEEGDIWVEADDGDKPYTWNGSSWTPMYTQIAGGSITTGTINAARISIGSSSTYADGYNPSTKTETQRQNAAPSTRSDGSTLVEGDIWLESDDGDKPYSWTGAAWQAAYTAINGGHITTGTIAAARVTVGSGTTFDTGFNPINRTDTQRQNSAPSTRSDGSALREGDQWVESDSGDKPYTWNGTSWTAAYTEIDGGVITTGTVNAARVAIGPSTTFTTGYDPTTKSVTIRQNTSPSTRPDGTALREGDHWIDANDGDRPYTWSGAAWIAALTIINGGNITTGTIDASVVTVTNINASNITTGSLDADRIGASTLSAITADLGSITAGSISIASNTWNSSGISFTRGVIALATALDGTPYSTNETTIDGAGLEVAHPSSGTFARLKESGLTVGDSGGTVSTISQSGVAVDGGFMTLNGNNVSLRKHTESTSPPSGGSNGDTHWNSTTSTLYMRAGGTWRIIN